MTDILRHTPRFSVEAVALDTETTGLDPRTARVIELGAVVLRNGEVQQQECFREFVATPQLNPEFG
jgi:CBS domain-containing protein